jgi:hypothetical protein
VKGFPILYPSWRPDSKTPGRAVSTGPAAGSRRGCRWSAGRAGSTSHLTATRPAGPSRLRGRSGPAAECWSRRRSLARKAISTTGCG